MRYEQSVIDNLKQQTDIVRLIGEYVELKKKGANYWGCCPFHGEKTASFSVNPSKGFYYCFGCSAKGSAFNFVMQIQNVGFGEAIKIVAEKNNFTLPAPQAQSKADEERYKAQKKAAEIKKSEAAIVIELNQHALEFWTQHLQENNSDARAAREYLEKRGITDATRKTFKLGYSPDKWDALISYLKSKGADEAAIKNSGLVSINDEKKRFYDRFRGRVMFPVLNIEGKPIAFGARILQTGEPKYLNSPETAAYTKGDNLYGLFQNAAEIRRRKYAILVEGYLDLITPFQYGVKNCVASLGTALTANQARLLNRFCKRVKVNYDGDKAGIKAAKRAIEILLGEELEVKVLVLPDGADPDDFIRKNGVMDYEEQHRKRSVTFVPFVLEQAMDGRDLRNPAEKVAAFDDILPFLRVTKNAIERQEFFDAAINRFGIDEANRAQLLKTLRQDAANSNKPDYIELRQRFAISAAAKPTIAEGELLELLIADEELRELVLPMLEASDYEHLATAAIFRAFYQLREAGVMVNAENLIEIVGENDLLGVLLLNDSLRQPDEAIDDYLIKAEKNVVALRVMAIERRLRAIRDETTAAEQTGDNERLNLVIAEQFELSRLRQDLLRLNS